jgi:hypothetical protein
MDESDRRPDAGQANSELTTELKRDVRTRSADWSALPVGADEVIEQSSRMVRPVFVRLRNDFCISASELKGRHLTQLKVSR